MSDPQIYLTIGVFAAVILLIMFDLIDMAVAALLGVSVLFLSGILDGTDLMPIVHTAGGPLALLFGGMVVARVIGKTGIFDWLGDAFLRATGGSGKRLLLLIVGLVAPSVRRATERHRRHPGGAGHHWRLQGPQDRFHRAHDHHGHRQ